MIINSLIRALLEENRVVVSGLGTFYLKKFSSQIKDEVVYPPQNLIEFEYAATIDDFDFVSKLSQWEQIRLDKAQEQVLNWVELIEKGLEHDKSLFFNDFGTFSKDSLGNIVFQSVINAQLNIENEGFNPITLPAQKNKKTQHAEPPIKDKREVMKIKKRRKKDRFWYVSTIVATLLLLGALFFKDSIKEFYQTYSIKIWHSDNEDAKPEQTALISSIASNETDTAEIVNIIIINEEIENVQEPVLENNVSKEIKKNTEITATLPETNDLYLPFQEGKFYVIAGSFAKESDALRHIKEKKLEKYHAKLLVQPQNQRIRVCIGIFENEKDAVNFAAQIDKNYWVLK